MTCYRNIINLYMGHMSARWLAYTLCIVWDGLVNVTLCGQFRRPFTAERMESRALDWFNDQTHASRLILQSDHVSGPIPQSDPNLQFPTPCLIETIGDFYPDTGLIRYPHSVFYTIVFRPEMGNVITRSSHPTIRLKLKTVNRQNAGTDDNVRIL